jgi:hypothetical protein
MSVVFSLVLCTLGGVVGGDNELQAKDALLATAAGQYSGVQGTVFLPLISEEPSFLVD